MQCIKLVNAGFVDKVIIFDTLPDRFMKDIKTRAVEGFPRGWAKHLGEIGSLRPVYKTTTIKRGPGDYEYTHTEIGKEPCFFVLEYVDTNSDKEAWRMISEYIRMNCGPEVRLKEKLEDMALAMAPNSTTALSIEPEDIPVIPVPSGIEETKPEIVKEGETVLVRETPRKKRGRPKKVAVEA